MWSICHNSRLCHPISSVKLIQKNPKISVVDSPVFGTTSFIRQADTYSNALIFISLSLHWSFWFRWWHVDAPSHSTNLLLTFGHLYSHQLFFMRAAHLVQVFWYSPLRFILKFSPIKSWSPIRMYYTVEAQSMLRWCCQYRSYGYNKSVKHV